MKNSRHVMMLMVGLTLAGPVAGRSQSVSHDGAVTGGGGLSRAGVYQNQSALGQIAARSAGSGPYRVASGSLGRLIQPTSNTVIPGAPFIAEIPDQMIDEDGITSAIPFKFGDDDTPFLRLEFTKASSNPALIPLANIQVAGGQGDGTVRVRPVENGFGSALITLGLSDGTHRVERTFEITVNPINDPPLLSQIVNAGVNEDTSSQPIPFKVGDIETAAAKLVVTASAEDSNLVPSSGILLGGEGIDRWMVITPAANQFGKTTITYRVSDGEAVTERTFPFSVLSRNDPPTISPIADVVILSGGSGTVQFSLADVDNPVSDLRVLAQSEPATFFSQASMALHDLGGGLYSLTLTSKAGQTGTAVITLAAVDPHGAPGRITFKATVTDAAASANLDGFKGSAIEGAKLTSNPDELTATELVPGAGVAFDFGEAHGISFRAGRGKKGQTVAGQLSSAAIQNPGVKMEVLGSVGGTTQGIIGILIAQVAASTSPTDSIMFSSSLPPGPWTAQFLDVNGQLLKSIPLAEGENFFCEGAEGYSFNVLRSVDGISNTIALSLLTSSPTKLLTIRLPNGDVLKSVYGGIFTRDTAGVMISSFNQAQFTAQGNMREFNVSDLAVIDGGFHFAAGCTEGCGTTLRSARNGEDFAHELTPAVGSSAALAYEIWKQPASDLTAPELNGWIDAIDSADEPGPDLDLGPIDLNKSGSRLSLATLISTAGSSNELVREIALTQSKPGELSLTATQGLKATGNEVAMETLEIRNGGVTVRQVQQKTPGGGRQSIGPSPRVILKAQAAPVDSIQPGLSVSGSGESSHSIHFAQVTTFTLADGSVVVGDEIVFKTSDTRLSQIQRKACITLTEATPSTRRFSRARRMDWGDLPPPYPTRLAQNGPRHRIVPALSLGRTVDPERNGQPSVNASGDDQNKRDDEDGVLFTKPLVLGSQAALTVAAKVRSRTAAGAPTAPATVFLDAFVDFNRDGDFADAGEKVFAKQGIVNGVNHLTFNVPSTAQAGRTFARFRLSSTGGLSYDGPAEDGEVEDYAVSILPLLPPAHPSGLALVPQGGTTLRTIPDGTAQLSDLAGSGSGVILQGDSTILSRRAGRIVTQLAPPIPQSGQGALLRAIGQYTGENGQAVPLQFSVLGGPDTTERALNMIRFETPFLAGVNVSVFGPGGRVGSLMAEVGVVGFLEGAGNITRLGWATFPPSAWIVLDQTATFSLPDGQTLAGTTFWFRPELEDEVIVGFDSLGLYSAVSGQGLLGLKHLSPKNPVAPPITGAQVAQGQLMLEFPGGNDTFFRLDYLDDLGDRQWKSAPTYELGEGTTSRLPAPPGGKQRFYRVVAE